MLEVKGISKHFGGIRAVHDASLEVGAGQIHALIGPNGAGKTTLFNLISGLYTAEHGTVSLNGQRHSGRAVRADLPPRTGALVPDHQPVRGLDDLREPAPLAAGAARHALQHLARHRQLSRSPRRDRRARKIPRSRRHRGDPGRRTVLWRAAAGRSRHRARLQAAGVAARRAAGRPRRRRARARLQPDQERRRQHSGADRRARHRPRARLLAARSP